jgi:Ca2+/Na+ antiporter
MIIISLVGLAVVFCALCIICDEHMIPAVEIFIEQFHVPEEIAAVTLVAFGSASPELLLNSVSAAQGKASSLSLPGNLSFYIILISIIIFFMLAFYCTLLF